MSIEKLKKEAETFIACFFYANVEIAIRSYLNLTEVENDNKSNNI